MISAAFINGCVKSIEDKQIKDGDNTPTAFKVFNLVLDCYIPEIGQVVPHSKIQRHNHQQYVLASNLEDVALWSSVPLGKPVSFQLAIFPKLSNGRAKLRYQLLKFTPLS